MKKLAYIIIAHNQPLILKKLVLALNENSDFYIHIDKSVDLKKFTDCFYGWKNVHFVEDRHWIQWGGFGIVRAQLSLLNLVLLRKDEYCRIIHLSGLDYPLVSNKKLYKNFSDNAFQYISGFNITKSHELNQKNRLTKYNFFKDVKSKSRTYHKILSYSAKKVATFLNVKKNDSIIIDDKKADVFFGSQFFAITPSVAEHVSLTIIRNPNLLSYFKTSFAPDEMLIQTIVINYLNDNRYSNNFCDLHKHATLHYFEYTSSIKIFTVEDYEKVMASGKMFIRKVTTEKSLALIDKIESNRKKSVYEK